MKKSKKVDAKFVIRNTDKSSYPMYWSDIGHGFTNYLREAARFTKEKGIKKLGELLHNSKTVCELVDVTTPYISPVPLGTVVLRHTGSKCISEMVVDVPEIKGGVLTFASPQCATLKLTIQEYLDELLEESIQVIWDPERSVIPENNDDYLDAHGFIHPNGEVSE